MKKKIVPLFLGDLAGKTIAEVRDWINTNFRVTLAEDFEICVGYWDDGAWEGSAWFLLRSKATGQMLEASGSHCSCFGFEDQWEPEVTTMEYLLSDKFSPGFGVDKAPVIAWLQENVKPVKRARVVPKDRELAASNQRIEEAVQSLSDSARGRQVLALWKKLVTDAAGGLDQSNWYAFQTLVNETAAGRRDYLDTI